MFDVGYYLRMLRYINIVKVAEHDFKLFIRALKFEESQFFILFEFCKVGNLIATETGYFESCFYFC